MRCPLAAAIASATSWRAAGFDGSPPAPPRVAMGRRCWAARRRTTPLSRHHGSAAVTAWVRYRAGEVSSERRRELP
jgi:hypothetical protein